METIEIQCGSCMQIMGVSYEHLGTQVSCPHCNAVVQAPDASALGMAPPPEPAQTPAWNLPMPPEPQPAWNMPTPLAPPPDHEDIFAAAPPPSDDIFGGPPAPTPQLPAPPSYQYQPQPPPSHHGFQEDAAATHEEPPVQYVRKVHRPSMVVPMIMIFLIPYSLATTGFGAWLYMTTAKQRNFDPLLDHTDQRDGPQQIKHDLEVPPSLRVGLNQTLHVGDLDVTPQKVTVNSLGDLVLHMRVRNTSATQELTPVSDVFCMYKDNMAAARPYTFLEPAGSKESRERLYGGFLQWLTPGNPLPLESGVLKPGQDMNILISTRDKDRTQAKRLTTSPQEALWRVQVRRGFVPTRDGPRSATCVVGVQFNTRAIEKSAVLQP